jgi:hypothetical protein
MNTTPESTTSSGPTADDLPFVPAGDPKPARAGSVGILDDKWYNLKFKYQDDKGNLQDGFAYYVGTNPNWAFWDYISATHSNGPVGKFKKDSVRGNRMVLKTDDGYFLSCRAGPRYWLYRSSEYPIGWEIVDGKLYTDYHDAAVGAEYHGVVVPDAYYMRVGGAPALINCEWVLASPQ